MNFMEVNGHFEVEETVFAFECSILFSDRLFSCFPSISLSSVKCKMVSKWLHSKQLFQALHYAINQGVVKAKNISGIRETYVDIIFC